MDRFLKIYAKQNGFTLIEGLITVLVISSGFLALASLQLNIWRNHSRSVQNIEAVQLGFGKLNEQRKLVSMPQFSQAQGQDKINSAMTHYDRSWRSSPLTASGLNSRVEINWESLPDKHSLIFQTIISRDSRADNGIWISRFD